MSTQIPRSVLNDYKQLFTEWLPKYQDENQDRIVVAQFNHPDDDRKDYGRTKYTIKRDGTTRTLPNFDGDDNAFRTATDKWVRTIAILSGPADANDKGTTTVDEHADIDPRRVRIWHRYLDLGLHLSPVADQDNHSKTWGNRTTARTGTWVQGTLTKQSLLKAFQENRTYASEDQHLTVWYTINDQPMGARFKDVGDQDLNIKVVLNDPDEPQSRYVVRLLRETIGDGELPVEVDKSATALSNNVAWESTIEHLKDHHEAYIVHVTQTGSNGQVNIAWTAPIWIEPAETPDDHDEEPAFVKSRFSNVYHFATCAVAEEIKARGNLIDHNPQAADGTRLHKHCPSVR